MKIEVENVSVNFKLCPMCGGNFDLDATGNKKRTINHGIPKFLKPKHNVLFPLCKECHQSLNSYYNMPKINSRKLIKSEFNSFEMFKETYIDLEKQFSSKKINRGQFGKSLWDNLLKYLESVEQKMEERKI